MTGTRWDIEHYHDPQYRRDSEEARQQADMWNTSFNSTAMSMPFAATSATAATTWSASAMRK